MEAPAERLRENKFDGLASMRLKWLGKVGSGGEILNKWRVEFETLDDTSLFSNRQHHGLCLCFASDGNVLASYPFWLRATHPPHLFLSVLTLEMGVYDTLSILARPPTEYPDVFVSAVSRRSSLITRNYLMGQASSQQDSHNN